MFACKSFHPHIYLPSSFTTGPRKSAVGIERCKRRWDGNCAIAAIRFQWTPGLVKPLSLKGRFLSCDRIYFGKLSGFGRTCGLLSAGKDDFVKCKHTEYSVELPISPITYTLSQHLQAGSVTHSCLWYIEQTDKGPDG